MPNPFPIREIARQAGVSEATVDRVLHGRPGVRAGTIVQIESAIADLERQRTQLHLTGRSFVIDLVMDAPRRFSNLVRRSLEAELPFLQPAAIGTRFHLDERWPVEDLVARLKHITTRGSDGIILKAPDTPQVVEAIGALSAAGIPVVTMVTDIPASRRLAYVGMNDAAAGSTAAYLIRHWLARSDAAVLALTSRHTFRGEEERRTGFLTAMRDHDAGRRIVELSDTEGLDDATRTAVDALLQSNPDIRAVYSIGGGNRGVVDAFAALGRVCEVFVGHDLADDNRALLQLGHLSAVLHHDVREDLRFAVQTLMIDRGALPGPIPRYRSKIEIVTPHNIPR